MSKTEIIKNYISQGECIMNKHKEIWKPEYSEVLSELKSIADNASNDEAYAYHLFKLTEISKFSDFGQYIHSQDAETCNIRFQTRIHQIKSKRICHQCGESEFVIVDGVQVCKKCKAEVKTTGCSQLIAKETNDNSKHIMKQLKILTNEVNPPLSISNMICYLKMWFHDRSFLHDWLIYSNQMDNWKEKYDQMLLHELPSDFFTTTDTHQLPDYKLFKMFTDEFYNMTMTVKKYREFDSNMLDLNDSDQVDICREYYTRFGRVPSSEDEIEVDGVKYQIGHYILHQLIQDVNCETELKKELNSIFKSKLVLPGLMFDQSQLEYVAKKFTYQQNYMFIIHEVFGVKYFNILESDKQQICKLMVDFNNYFKELKRNRMGKNCNSCLWQISLRNILRLPYFHCYSDIIQVLPDKYSNTTLMTNELWNQYQISHLDEMNKYRNILRREKPNELVNVTTKIIEDDIDQTKIMDFINGTGESFDRDENDKYLKEKIHMKDSDHSWTNDFSLIDVNQTLKCKNELELFDDPLVKSQMKSHSTLSSNESNDSTLSHLHESISEDQCDNFVQSNEYDLDDLDFSSTESEYSSDD